MVNYREPQMEVAANGDGNIGKCRGGGENYDFVVDSSELNVVADVESTQ
jgi:hypothetical protein